MAQPSSQPVWLEVALLSGRTEVVHAEPHTSLRQLKLDAGQLLQVSIATLNRSDGSMLEEMMTIQEAALENGEILYATAANVRVEMEGEALRLLKLLDTNQPAKINDAVYQVADLEIEGAEEMAHLFQLILDKALATPRAAAPCTDMMCGLRERYPNFEETAEDEQCHLVTSSRLLLNVVQANYEKLFTDDPNDKALQKKNWWSGWMQVFGHLLMRRLIAVKVVGTVLHDMIGVKEEDPERLPEEDMLLAACELLEICGEYLDRTHQRLVQTIFNRLNQLARHADFQRLENFAQLEGRQADTPAVVYSHRAGRRIQEVRCWRACQWKKGPFWQ